MSKNEIHTRVTPDVMERLKQLMDTWELPTISHVVRRLIGISIEEINREIQFEQKFNSLVQLIENELEVVFTQYRDEYDPENGELYWFWCDADDDTIDWLNGEFTNTCPAKRFKLREEAIRDCLKEKIANKIKIQKGEDFLNRLIENQVKATCDGVSNLPSSVTNIEPNEDTIIDW